MGNLKETSYRLLLYITVYKSHDAPPPCESGGGKGVLMNSKDKGARFERKLATMIKGYGFEARRGQQYCGANGDPDVVGLPFIHIEAKHQERMQLYDWMAQSIHDAKEGEYPAVFHKKNNCEVLVTMRFDDWMDLYRGFLDEKS